MNFLSPEVLLIYRQMQHQQNERTRHQRNLATDLALAASRLRETLRRARQAREAEEFNGLCRGSPLYLWQYHYARTTQPTTTAP